MPARRHARTVTVASAALSLLALTACGTDDPATPPATSTTPPDLTAPTSTPDPAEDAEEVAIESVQRYWTVYQQAGLSGDWSDQAIEDAARGTALSSLVTLGESYGAAGWLFEGQVVVSDLTVEALTLDSATVVPCADLPAATLTCETVPELVPELVGAPDSAIVVACVDLSEWALAGEPAGGTIPERLITHVTVPEPDGTWYVRIVDDGGPACAS